MIGISGRCSAERRSSSGLYPFPFDARARRGCTSISASKTGCQWRRALVSETSFTMPWAYLMVVSRPSLGVLDSRFEVFNVLSLLLPPSSAHAKIDLVTDERAEG
jgi:Periviscerokinin family